MKPSRPRLALRRPLAANFLRRARRREIEREVTDFGLIFGVNDARRYRAE